MIPRDGKGDGWDGGGGGDGGGMTAPGVGVRTGSGGVLSGADGGGGVRMSVGYMLLRYDLSTPSDEYGCVTLSREWQETPGDGAHVALSVRGLLWGQWCPVLAEVEYEGITRIVVNDDVISARRVRIIRTTTPDAWVWFRVAFEAAQLVAYLSRDPRVAAAIAAAEQCKRERTPAASRAVGAALVVAEAAEAAVRAATAEWAAKRAAEAAEAAARRRCAAEAAEAKKAAEAAKRVAEAAEAAGAANGKDRRVASTAILARLVAEAWPEEAAVRP